MSARRSMSHGLAAAALVLLMITALVLPGAAAAAMYRCPSPQNPDDEMVTNLLNDADAKQRGCAPLRTRRSTLDEPAHAPAQPVRATAPAPAPRAVAATPAVAAAPVSPADAENRKVSAKIQRLRDDDRRTILETELRNMQEALTRVRQRGQAVAADDAERRRWEQDVARHLADVEAIKRELSRLP